MARTFTVTYTPQVIKEGNRVLMMRKWRFYPGLVILMGLMFLSAYWTSQRGPVDAVPLISVFLLILALPFLIYFMANRTTAAEGRKLLSPTGTVQVTDDAMILRADTGSNEMVWRTIEQVWTHPRIWLVAPSKRMFLIVPITEADDEIRKFICQKVTESGGKCR